MSSVTENEEINSEKKRVKKKSDLKKKSSFLSNKLKIFKRTSVSNNQSVDYYHRQENDTDTVTPKDNSSQSCSLAIAIDSTASTAESWIPDAEQDEDDEDNDDDEDDEDVTETRTKFVANLGTSTRNRIWKSFENLNEDSNANSESKLEETQFYINSLTEPVFQSEIEPLQESDSPLKKETESIRNFKDMPAYGDLIVDTLMLSQEQVKPKDHLYKILVIGDLGTGKTSIIKRYVHEFFSQHYRATIGVDFALKVLNWDENTRIRLQLWDIAGQERYGNMTRVYYKEAVGAFIVFDVTRINTFESVINWKTDLDSKVQLPDGSPIPCVLLANKCDQPKEGVVNNTTKMEEFCKEKGFSAWFETSAKENINIDEAARALVNQILLNDKIINNSNYKDADQFSLVDQKRNSGKCAC